MKGIDVSNHNGNIDFSQVKNDGVELVYIKATEGTTYQDEYLDQHYNGALSQGLKVGFYHFLVGTSEPETQAENFYNQIKDKQNSLKPCLDIEKNGFDVMDYVIRFIDKFKELSDMDIVIYTGPYFANDNLDNRLCAYPCWIANYGVDTPMKTNIWGSNYAGHQYTESGSVSGVVGNVDMNNFNNQILLDITSASSVVSPTSSISILGYGKVTASILNVRDNPDGEIIGTLTKDDIVKIDKGVEGWYSIYWGEHGGYVAKDYVNVLNGIDGVMGTVKASVLNVRDSIDGNIIGHLNQGEKVELCRQEGNWYHIYYGDKGAWVSADYVEV